MTLLENLRELALLNCLLSFVLGFIIVFMNGLEIYAVFLLLTDTRNVPSIVYVSLLSATCLALDSLVVLTVYALCVGSPVAAQRLVSNPSLRGVNPLRTVYEP
jgi:hypothetical protein